MASDEETAVMDEDVPAPEAASGEQAPAAEAPEKPAAAAVDKDKKRAKKSRKAPSQKDAANEALSLAAHPRAARRVAEAKAWAAVAGFALGGYLSLPTHALADAAVRALVAGIACRTFAWAVAVFVWRRMVAAELRNAQHKLLSARIGQQSTQPQER